MRKRTERIQAQMDEADAALAKANSLIAEYDAKLKSIGDERVKVLEAARLEVPQESKEIIAEAKRKRRGFGSGHWKLLRHTEGGSKKRPDFTLLKQLLLWLSRLSHKPSTMRLRLS